MEIKLVRFDWAIKKLLRSKANFNVLEGFLSELLKTDITIIEILESESNKQDAFDKHNRVDMLVKNSADERIIIEVQVEDQLDYVQRMLYASSKVIAEHMKKGEPYKSVKKVYSVNVLYFELGNGKDYVYHGATHFRGIHFGDTLALSDKQCEEFKRSFPHELMPEYYIINVNSFNDVAKDTLDEWIYFLKHDTIQSGFTAKGIHAAEEQLSVMKLSEAEQRAYRDYEESLHDKASYYESTFVQGRKEGLKQGIKDGIKKGLKKGHQQGKAEGLQVALQRLLDNGIDAKKAKQMLGLDG